MVCLYGCITTRFSDYILTSVVVINVIKVSSFFGMQMDGILLYFTYFLYDISLLLFP